MEKQDLISYKEKLSKLSLEENKKREKYLMDMSNGLIAGPQIGYPTIDMPWMHVYDEDIYFSEKPKETVVEALFNNNEDNLETVALNYFGNKITYRQFEINILDLARSFKHNGVGNNSYVGVCLAGIPEAMASIYSLNYLGAVGMFMAPYQDEENMIKDLKKNGTKVLFMMDLFYEKGKEKFDRVVEKAGIEKLVIVPTLNSSIIGKFLKKKKYKNKKIVTYNDFIKEGKDEVLGEMVKYEKDKPAAVVYSSGTTGILKGVLLSNDSINNISRAYTAFGFDLSRGQSIYQAIPVWSSTGLVAVGTIPLFFGATLYENPKFDPVVFCKNLGAHDINWGVGTTELLNGLEKIEKSKIGKFKIKHRKLRYNKLHTVLIGGTFSSPKDKKRLNNLFKRIGCPAKANSGYGTCENGSTVTAELNKYDYPDYSIGHPIPGVKIMAIDENDNELPYNVRGQLAVKTDCGMLRYYNRDDLNKKIFFKDKGSNVLFKHTGDIGYVRPDGIVIYEGRGNDTSIVNGETLYNFDVKKVFLDDKDVEDAEVFINPNGNLCANVIFYDKNIDVNSKIKELQSKVYDKFKNNNYVPVDFKVLDQFPMASSTKRDYAKIKAEKDGYINVPFAKAKTLKKFIK